MMSLTQRKAEPRNCEKEINDHIVQHLHLALLETKNPELLKLYDQMNNHF